MKNVTLYTTITLLFTGIVFFGVGFFFGYKTKVNTVSTLELASSNNSNASLSSLAIPVTTTSSQATAVNPISGADVFWIKVGTNPVCPETHPIKGKFDTSTAKFYYTTENRSYDRVRPDICFTTEAFAKETAGFVKKF